MTYTAKDSCTPCFYDSRGTSNTETCECGHAAQSHGTNGYGRGNCQIANCHCTRFELAK